MKKIISLLLLGSMALFLLAGCGGKDNSPAQPDSTEPPVSSGATPKIDSSGDGSEASAPAVNAEGLQAMLDTVADAAGLGGTIAVDERDLKFGGVNTDDIEAAKGAQAQTSAENGGIAIVVLAKSGRADAVKADFETYRDNSAGNEDYAEFETARENTKQARIVVNGDYVVYAVSATGDWDALDTAIAGLF